MIWHIVEIWFTLLAAFVIGCGLGAALYAVLAHSPLATPQGRLADAIGDAIDGVKIRLGIAPEWRPSFGDQVRGTPEARDRGWDRGEAWPLALPEPAGSSEEHADDLPRDDWDRDDAAGVGWDVEEDWPRAVGTSLGDEREVFVDSGESVDEGAGAEPEPPAMRPIGLSAPRNGVPDDLQRIRGIGRRNEELLNDLGIFHFSQIAAWTPAEMAWVSRRLAFPERIGRDDWIGQATILAAGGDAGHVRGKTAGRAGRGS